MSASLFRRAVAEALGTALLLAAIVGSGIMGERLAGGNVAIALLANSIATGAVLAALILTVSPLSGAHLNPLVTTVVAWRGEMRWTDVAVYIGAQLSGAFAGVAAANLMFGGPPFAVSQHVRQGGAQVFSEFIATFGLLFVIVGCARMQPRLVAFAVGAYITAAYWFTGSTSFANPAVTLARSVTDTFTGIRPLDAPAFVLAQIGGAIVAAFLTRWLFPRTLPKESE